MMNAEQRGVSNLIVGVAIVIGVALLAVAATVSSRLIWDGADKPERLLFLVPADGLDCGQAVAADLEAIHPELLTTIDARLDRLNGPLDEELALVVVGEAEEIEVAVRALDGWVKVDSSRGVDVFADHEMTPVEREFSEQYLERCL